MCPSLQNLKLFLISLLLGFANITNAKTLNGFDLTNTAIPAKQIFSGGPPRDGIPAIDQPHFVPASKAGFMQSGDRVLGIVINGKARAYPIKILNWHEIVNDIFSGKALVVTYCPLCGSGIIYDARVNGKRLSFGVSGLLYNSDMLLYDRQTKSLWSQILSKAISGSLRGKSLKIISSSRSRWGLWKKQHPNTDVLSTNTGFDRDYKHSPYGNYDKSSKLYFQVAAKSKKYHPKERVLGISINGKYKSYPFIELARQGQSPLNDSFAGKRLSITFNAANRDGIIKDQAGHIIPSINSFWFAWFAFHPDTAVYSAP